MSRGKWRICKELYGWSAYNSDGYRELYATSWRAAVNFADSRARQVILHLPVPQDTTIGGLNLQGAYGLVQLNEEIPERWLAILPDELEPLALQLLAHHYRNIRAIW